MSPVSVGQESGLSFAVFCLKVSHKAALEVLVRIVFLSEGSVGEESTSKLTDVVVSRLQFLLGYRTQGLSSSLAFGQK